MNTQARYQKRVIIAGGSGFLGTVLTKYFNEDYSRVTILTRHPRERDDYVREIAWDGQTLGPWAKELDGAEIVINLTGRSVDCRYNAQNRKEILESRINSTRVIGEAIAKCERAPDVWLNASTATVYKHTFGPPHDETSVEMDSATDAKDAFSVEVAQAWERALDEAPKTRTRKVALRTSMVLGLGRNSVFPVLRRLTKFGLGGRQGNGKQFVSWIHQDDFCRAINWIINYELAGPINLCAPNPLPNAEMMRIFREICHRPIGLPANKWMLEIGAFFMRTETELIFKSRRVVPGRLLKSGFTFLFPQFHDAAIDLEKRMEG